MTVEVFVMFLVGFWSMMQLGMKQRRPRMSELVFEGVRAVEGVDEALTVRDCFPTSEEC